MTDETCPPMPATEAEWRVYWAFYRMTIAQRDAAWREISALNRQYEALIEARP
jgi:hypothetical protein